MANNKRKVSPIDFFDCYHYFKRAIHENKLMKSLNNDEVLQRAIQEFPKLNPDDPNNEAIASLQEWIDDFVNDETWRKCYRFLNQKKYLANKKHKTIHITETAHNLLQEYAKNNDLTLSMAIIEALAIADFLDHSKKEEAKPTKPSTPSYDFSVHSKVGTSNIVSLFKNNLPIPVQVDLKQEPEPLIDWFDDPFDYMPEYPRRPENYNFKQNESYKKYREHIKLLTVKDIDNTLLAQFDKTFSYYLTTENVGQVGNDIINFRNQLVEHGFFSTKFVPEDFVISAAISLPEYQLNGYADEFMYFIANAFGCISVDITSGKKTLSVFAGMRNHVQIAYKMFNYLNAFLSEEMDNFLKKCHKNTKKKNRYLKAGWYTDDLGYKMLKPVFELDDEHDGHFYAGEEKKALSNFVSKKVHRYYDENEPIGGWRD